MTRDFTNTSFNVQALETIRHRNSESDFRTPNSVTMGSWRKCGHTFSSTSPFGSVWASFQSKHSDRPANTLTAVEMPVERSCAVGSTGNAGTALECLLGDDRDLVAGTILVWRSADYRNGPRDFDEDLIASIQFVFCRLS
jgi:hypothetical protein